MTESLVRLTPRDKELLAHVAMARYLSSAQIKRLVFASRRLEQHRRDPVQPPSDQVCRRRLGRLSSGEGGIAYLHRLSCRNDDGLPVVVYAVTPHGQAIAREVLRHATPPGDKDANARFVARTVALNELYVELAGAAAKSRRGPAQFPFAWIAAESAGLPWRERDQKTGRIDERRLMPDAVLELPAERTRVFLECETMNALARREERVLGSALSKLQRYGAFMLEGGQPTFYGQKYADGWKAELMFLTRSGDRASKLTSAISEWREHNRAVPLVPRAFSFSQAIAHLCARLRLQGAPGPRISVDAADLQLTCSFVSEVTAAYKAVRHYLRANPGVRAQGCPYPEYTTEFERMVALAERLRGQLGDNR